MGGGGGGGGVSEHTAINTMDYAGTRLVWLSLPPCFEMTTCLVMPTCVSWQERM